MNDDLTMWSLIVGFFVPLLVSVIQQPRWSGGLRAVVALVVCLVVGGVTAYLNDDFGSGRSVVSACLVTAVTGMAMYQRFWKPVGVAPAIEHATSPSSTR